MMSDKNLENKVASFYKMDEEEKHLYDWVFPVFKNHFDALKTYGNIQYPWLVIGKSSKRPFHAVISSKKRKIKNQHIVYLPSHIIEDAKHDFYKKIKLYSGKKIACSAKTYLDYVISHEVKHCFNETGEADVDEAAAWMTGCKRIFPTFEGESLVAAMTSILLVEANLLGHAKLLDLRGVVLPYNFSDSSLKLIQYELDDYILNPEKAKKIYHQKKNYLPLKGQDYEDNYSKGLVKLLKSLNSNL